MKITTGISIDAKIFRLAKNQATKERRTFSNYVEGLIMADVAPVINNEPDVTPRSKLKRRAVS